MTEFFKEKRQLKTILVCALSAEANPLRIAFKLQHHCSEYGFRLYLNQQSQVGLLITGVGKVNTAAALMWVQQIGEIANYLNVGIIGHGSGKLGDHYLINKVFDVASGKTYYPAIHFKWKFAISQLQTVDLPQDHYIEGIGFDMEASAFLYVARKFVTAESVHVFKVVSDNNDSSYRQINAEKVEGFIQGALEPINHLIFSMQVDEVTRIELSSDLFDQMNQRWHITVSQKQQLFDLYHSATVVHKNTGCHFPDWTSHMTVNDYLRSLKEWLNVNQPKL